MSQQKSYTIKCPECEHDQEVTLYESVNVGTEPQLRAQLLANEINNIQCDACGFEFRVDKTLLYTDPGRQFMVYCVPESEDDPEAVTELIQQAMSRASSSLPDGVVGPTIHLTLNRTEMIEKIFILEAELDPRIIEYIKYTIFTRNLETLHPEQKGLLFDAEDSTDEHLLFVVQNLEDKKLETVLQYSRSGYDSLTRMFDQDEETADLLELFPGPYISARYALLEEMEEVLHSEDAEDLFNLDEDEL